MSWNDNHQDRFLDPKVAALMTLFEIATGGPFPHQANFDTSNILEVVEAMLLQGMELDKRLRWAHQNAISLCCLEVSTSAGLKQIGYECQREGKAITSRFDYLHHALADAYNNWRIRPELSAAEVPVL